MTRTEKKKRSLHSKSHPARALLRCSCPDLKSSGRHRTVAKKGSEEIARGKTTPLALFFLLKISNKQKPFFSSKQSPDCKHRRQQHRDCWLLVGRCECLRDPCKQWRRIHGTKVMEKKKKLTIKISTPSIKSLPTKNKTQSKCCGCGYFNYYGSNNYGAGVCG